MKYIFLLFFASITIQSFSQCEECTSFEEALKKPEMVKSIMINPNIGGVLLDSVPKFIGSFINLEALFLTDQNIKTLPPEIGNLKKLRELSFAGCKLTSVPDFIFSMKNLKQLLLGNNPFSEDYKVELKVRLKKELPGTKLF